MSRRRIHLIQRLVLTMAATFGFCQLAFADLAVRGFADVIGSTTNTDLPISWINNYGRQFVFDSSRLGLNLSAQLSDEWQFAGQAIARGDTQIGKQGGYIISADWLFFTYRPDEHWRFRAGRQIFPLYLFSEQLDVGFTYLWINLPITIYGIVPVKSFNGLSVSYSEEFGNLNGSLSLFAGTGYFDQLSSGIGGMKLHDQYVKGANLSLSNDNYKLSASYKSSHPVGTNYLVSGSGSEIQVPLDIGNVQNFSFGASAHFNHLIAIGELGTSSSSIPDAYNLTGYYGTLGYEFFNAKLTPHLTFAEQWLNSEGNLYPDATVDQSDPSGARETRIQQLILGFNYRATVSTIVKLGYERDQFAFRNSTYNFGADTFNLAIDAVF